MVGVAQRSRFLFCVLLLLANLAVQLFLWLSFSFMSLPEHDFQMKTTECTCPTEFTSPPVRITCATLPPVATGRDLQQRQTINDSARDTNHYLLVVVILSSVEGRDRRDAIRRTWMKGYESRVPPVLIKFVIGTYELGHSGLESLVSEEDLYHDLLLLPNLKESYQNLTRKVLYTYVWVAKNLRFSYLMKCDDDTFVILDTVLKELAERSSVESYYWGFFDGRASPKNRGKWTEREWFLCDHYLPYALGGGYVVSSDLVEQVALSADKLQIYSNEDVSVGVWLSAYEAERRHDVRFNTEYVSRGCRNSYIVSHKQTIDDMRSKYRSLQMKSVQCEREYQTRPSYEYNWNEAPSKCCERRKGIP